MRNSITAVIIVLALFLASPLLAQSTRVSPHETISAVIGDRRTGNRVTITYGRPYSKAPRGNEVRKIWGALVPWDKAWRMGSDEATILTTQQDLQVGDTVIPAGAYTLYFVPSENGTSKLAFSKKLGGWGIPVDESADLARVDVKKKAVENKVDQFTMAIENDAATGGGVIKWTWENVEYSLPFTVKK
jgi:hypothetical protein